MTGRANIRAPRAVILGLDPRITGRKRGVFGQEILGSSPRMTARVGEGAP